MDLHYSLWGFPSSSVVKNPPAMQEMQEMWVQSLGQNDSLEKGMATHAGILAARSLTATVHGVAKSQTQLSNEHTYTVYWTCSQGLNQLILAFHHGNAWFFLTLWSLIRLKYWHLFFYCLPKSLKEGSLFSHPLFSKYFTYFLEHLPSLELPEFRPQGFQLYSQWLGWRGKALILLFKRQKSKRSGYKYLPLFLSFVSTYKLKIPYFLLYSNEKVVTFTQIVVHS